MWLPTTEIVRWEGLGDRVGDPVPLFELVLAPRAARLAVSVLGVVTATGVALLVLRSRSMRSTNAAAATTNHLRRERFGR